MAQVQPDHVTESDRAAPCARASNAQMPSTQPGSAPLSRGSTAAGGVDQRLNLLKIMGSMAVVVVHTAVLKAAQVNTADTAWWWANIGDAAGRFGSAIFVMVGGAILLARPSENRPVGFVLERLARLLPAVVFWSVFYFIWRQWMWGGLTWQGMARDVLLGSPWYHLWFVYMMLALYVFMPPLRVLVKDARYRHVQRYAVAACAVATCAAASFQTLQQVTHSSFVGLAPFFVVYLVGGYLLYNEQPPVSAKVLLLGCVLCVGAMAAGVGLLHPLLGDWSFVLMYSNRGPFAMGLTFCIFLLALKLPRNGLRARGLQPLAAVTLGIYVIHPFWIDMMARFGWGLDRFGGFWVLMACAVYGLSASTALLMARIPLLKNVVR